MKNQEAPPLTGPSEYGQSIVVTVSPDVLTQDGASQSLVTITVRGPNGEPLRNVSLRAEIFVNGERSDFGTLSAHNLVTGADGRATLVYTAPALPAGFNVDSGTQIQIGVTAIGSDFGNSTIRIASIRLVPPGTVVPPADLNASFTITPQSPSDHQTVFFDASASETGSKSVIASYAWNFGDGSTGSGKTTTHSYNFPGSYVVTLTISDSIGRVSSLSKTVDVGAGDGPEAVFTASPGAPRIGQQVNFNASASKPAAGRIIRTYVWDFGDGDPTKTTTTPLTTHDYQRSGTFIVTLVVTDDAGRQGVNTLAVTVLTDAPTADFTAPKPIVNQPVTFSGANSSAIEGRTIVSYFWDFGGGTPSTSTSISPTVRFGSVGDFNVTLTVTDNAGKVGRVTKTVTVAAAAP